MALEPHQELSLSIRKVISLAKKRLERHLGAYSLFKESLELAPEAFDDIQLYDLFERASECFEKAIERLEDIETVDRQWAALIQQHPEEAVVRADYINEKGDYAPIVAAAQAMIDHIRKRIQRLGLAVEQRLGLSERKKVEPSEGTMYEVPKNEDIFNEIKPNPAPPMLQNPTNLDWTSMLYLPHVEIPKFNGNPSRWNEFWSLFQAMIDKRNIEPCVKLFHLRAHLEGEARESLAHLSNSDQDYPVAKTTLLDLYGNPQRVTHRLRSELINYHMKEKGATQLYRGWSRMNQIYAQLKNLGDPTDNTVLAQIVESKFPRYVLQKVYKTTTTSLKGSDMLQAIGEVLRKEANLDRIMSDNRADFFKQKQKENHDNKDRKFHKDPVLTHHTDNVESKEAPNCNLCDRQHFTYKCPTYTEVKDRIRQIKVKGLCRNCLKIGHVAAECPSKGKCKHCGQRHHSTICLKNDPGGDPSNQSTNKTKQVKFEEKKSKSAPHKKENVTAVINEDETNDQSENCHTHLTSTPNSKQTTILMTTTSLVSKQGSFKKGREVTVFIDSGSTKTYVTEELVKSLQLKEIGEETLNINTFGNQTLPRRVAKIYRFEVRPLGTTKKPPVLIQATALPQLTSFLHVPDPEGIAVDHIPLKRASPQILIGMDQIHKLEIESKPIKIPSGFFLASSTIGSILYGNGQTLFSHDELKDTYHSYQSEEIKLVNGSVKLYLGPMWSGKTTYLIQELSNLHPDSCLVIKHKADNRYESLNCLATHNGQTFECKTGNRLNDFWDEMMQKLVIVIDEVHFFPDAADFIQEMAYHGKRIIAAGIHTNHLQKPLPNMANLIAIADEIIMLRSKCKVCGEPTPFTKRYAPIPSNPNSPSEWIGGAEAYINLCRQHFQDPTPFTQDSTQVATHHTLMINTETIETTLYGEDSKLNAIDEQLALSKLLTRFWRLEELGINDDANRNDDDIAMEAFLKTVKRNEDGRYICSWPWKMSNKDLPSNFTRSLGRLRSTLRKLNTDQELFTKYQAIFDEQLANGIIEEVKKGQRDGTVHYIPHQPVINPLKTTTKIRIVYDASCKTSNGKSLNDYLFKGPVLLPDLVGMLLRFRMTPIPLLADVEKAFLQLELALSDRDCTRFLWIKDKQLPAEGDNLVVYRFARVPFGVISSPFLLAGAIDQHLYHYPHPLAKSMRRNAYVDNILIECDTAEEAIKAFYDSRAMFKDAKMNLREFQTSHPVVQKFLEEQGMAVPATVKVLGVPWSCQDDTISLNHPKVMTNPENPTKRSILKYIASFFDPIGIVVPLIVQAKLFIQTLWTQECKWDQILDDTTKGEWQKIYKEISQIQSPTIPRIICSTHPTVTQLHVFCDASMEAYAAVAYLRTESKNGIEVNFLMGKARIRPIKPITIPRMELLALLIASTLAKKICEEIDILPYQQIYIWSDSMIALAWLKTERTLPTFVKNRVNSIWKNVPKAQIQYVPTQSNPADCATRKLTIEEYKASNWLKGSEWLKMNEDNWPTQPVKFEEEPTDLTAISSTIDENILPFNLIDFKRYSRWSTAVNILVIIVTFIRKVITSRAPRNSGKLKEIWDSFDLEKHHSPKFIKAEIIAFRLLQRENPPNKKRRKELQLYEDSDNKLLRCQTRLTKSILHLGAAAPIYLPPDNFGTRLYIVFIHQLLKHAPPSITLSNIRLRVWIPKARVVIKSAINSLCSCRDLIQFELPKFPQLPSFRVTPNTPFRYTGVDYAGPIQVRMTKTQDTKTWICLFTCLTCRAIHTELVYDVSTLSFLQALRRFISRRGTPAIILSDNATHFKAASQAIIKIWHESREIGNYLASHHIVWNYITENSPWQGGVWERVIGLTKSALNRAIGRKKISLPEMITVLTEVEAVLNSRPLTYIPSNESWRIIRPIDCIQPGANIGVPVLEEWDDKEDYEPNPTLNTKLINLWRKQQVILDKFWKLWIEDYLPSLAERTQITHKQPKSLVRRLPVRGEVVIIKDNNELRGEWKLAKVLEVEKPTKIKLQPARNPKKIIYRSPKHLYPLELDPSPNEEESKEESSEEEKVTKKTSIAQRVVERRRGTASFTGITMIIPILMSILTTNLVQGTTISSLQTTQTPNKCTTEECAPWRWECCSYPQKLGTIMWIYIGITIIPSVFMALRFLLWMFKWLYRFKRYLSKGRRKEPQPKEMPINQRRALRQRLKRMKEMILLAILFQISLNISPSNSCGETTSLTSTNEECKLDEDNLETNCHIKKSIQITVQPVGQDACINLQKENLTLPILQVRTNRIGFMCNYKEHYFTRNYKTDVENVHRCRNAEGSNCFNNWCENVKAEDKVNEFSKAVQDAPGHSRCTRSCQCISCNGCFLCSPSCLFWRLYAKPDDSVIYEIGSCPTWTPFVEVDLKWGNTSRRLHLRPADKTIFENTTITLQNFNIPQFPILAKSFLKESNGEKTAVVDSAPPNQPSPGTLGTFQCPDLKAAKEFKCKFPADICTCHPSDFTTTCSCNYVNPKEIITKKDNVLPLTSGPLNINYKKDKEFRYEASINQQSGVSIILGFDNLKLSMLEYIGKCKISVISNLKGCRACHNGATATIKCEAKLSINTKISCGTLNKFVVPCDNQTHEINIQTEIEEFKTTCNYTCAKTNGSFILEGKLDTIRVSEHKDKEAGGWWSKPAVDLPLERIVDDILKAVGNLFESVIKFLLRFPTIIGFIILIVIVAATMIRRRQLHEQQIYYRTERETTPLMARRGGRPTQKMHDS
jgi:thymidine kinase